MRRNIYVGILGVETKGYPWRRWGLAGRSSRAESSRAREIGGTGGTGGGHAENMME